MKPRFRLRADGSAVPTEPPTEREREVLARLEEHGVLRWTEVLQVDIPTLDRLVAKGLARRVEGPGRWEYWTSIDGDRPPRSNGITVARDINVVVFSRSRGIGTTETGPEPDANKIEHST